MVATTHCSPVIIQDCRSIPHPFPAEDRIKDSEIRDKYAMETIDNMKRRFNEGTSLVYLMSTTKYIRWSG